MELFSDLDAKGDFLTAWRATVMTRRRLASINAALARWERRICCLREGTVCLVAAAHWANVGGLRLIKSGRKEVCERLIQIFQIQSISQNT